MNATFRFRDWSLRAKMAAVLVVASVIPLAVATWIDVQDAKARLRANTASLLAARADHLADQLDTFHRGYQRATDRIAHLPGVVEFCQAGSADTARLTSTLRAVLEVWPASDPNIRGVGILDMSGRVKIATENHLVGQDLSFQTHVRQAMGGVAVISDIFWAEPEINYAPTIAYLAPVSGPDGKPIAIAILLVRAESLWELMKEANGLAGPNSFAVLFDRLGIRIGHTYSKDIVFHPGGRLATGTLDALVAARRFGDKTRQLLEDVRAFPEQFDRARSAVPDRELFRGFAPVNQKWNFGVARRFETVPWTIFYMIPEESLDAPIAQMTRQKTIFAAAIIALALVAGVWFAAPIIRQIASLSTATKLIAGGNLAARADSSGSDELGRLGASFNSMAERIGTQAAALEGARDELELRVQARTAELVLATKKLQVEVAERKRAEEAAAQLAAIVESSDDAIVGKDLRGIVTSWNGGAERIFGYTASEMIDQPVARLIPPDRLGEETDILDRISHGKNVDHFETVRMRKSGRLIDVSVTVSPIKDSAGKVVGASKSARDITDRKLAEGKLRFHEAVLRETGHIAKVGGWSFDVVSGEGYWTDEVARIHDLDPADPVSKEIGLSYYHGESRQRIEAAVRAASEHGTPYDLELEITTAAGARKWIRTIGHPIKEEGKVVRIRGSFQDISERKLAERRFGTRNAVSRVLADATSLAGATPEIIRAICGAEGWDFGAIWEVDSGAGVLRCLDLWHDPEFTGEALATWTRGLTFATGCGLPGRVWASGKMLMVPEVTVDANYVRAAQANAAGLHSALAFPILMGNEVTGVIDFAAREIRQPDEQLEEMFTAIGRQVGQFIERCRAEEQVRRLNAELEQRVVERTAQLEMANKELEAFSYSVSHDLRSPLRTIDGFSLAVLEDFGPQLPEEGRGFLQTIREGAQRMGALIDDLLAFSRLGRQSLSRRTVDTEKLVRGVLEELHLPEQGQRIALRVPDLPSCQADPALLKQVWVNLLSNALKYSRKSDPATIEVGCTLENGVNTFFVRDNGTGFDMQYVHKLFGVFQRLHRAEDYEGTGVGLAIVQRIIHRHGGRVWAEGAPGRGATFYFTLEGESNHE